MAVFRGEVRQGGQPVSGARVAIHATGLLGGSLGETRTAPDGRFGFEVEARHTQLAVYVNGTAKGIYRVRDFATLTL